MRTNTWSALIRGGAALADLAWPTSCAVCGAWDSALCPACSCAFEPAPVVSRPVWLPNRTVHSAACFQGPLARAITAFKDENRRDVALYLTPLLRSAVAEAIQNSPVTVTEWRYVLVPSSSAAVRARGRFPLAELAGGLEGPALRQGPTLTLRRRVADQSRLSRIQRQANMADAHEVKAGQNLVGPRSGIVLIDDVVTTGATLAAAQTALNTLRPGVIAMATIAATGGVQASKFSQSAGRILRPK